MTTPREESRAVMLKAAADANLKMDTASMVALGKAQVAYIAELTRELEAPTRSRDDLERERDAAVEALREIALAGMSAPVQFTEEDTRRWHARRAWEFIGIAARALPAPHVRALAGGGE